MARHLGRCLGLTSFPAWQWRKRKSEVLVVREGALRLKRKYRTRLTVLIRCAYLRIWPVSIISNITDNKFAIKAPPANEVMVAIDCASN